MGSKQIASSTFAAYTYVQGPRGGGSSPIVPGELVQWVLKPSSGGSGPYVYDTLAGLIAGSGIATLAGERWIDVDLSLVGDVYSVPAGTYDFGTGVNLVGIVNPATDVVPQLTFALGVTFTHEQATTRDLRLSVSQTSGAVITDPGGAAGATWSFYGRSSVTTVGAGASPLVNSTAGVLTTHLKDLSSLFGIAPNTAPSFTSSASGVTTFHLWDESNVGQFAVSVSPNPPTFVLDSSGASINPFTYGPYIELLPGIPYTFDIHNIALGPNAVPIVAGIVGATFIDSNKAGTGSGKVWTVQAVSSLLTTWIGTQSNVVFQPGGQDSATVFTDWSVLCDYLHQIPGPKSIELDFQFQGSFQFALPVGGAFDFGDNVTIFADLSTTGGLVPQLQFVNFTTLTTPPVEVTDCVLVAIQDLDVIALTATNRQLVVNGHGSLAGNNSTGSVMINVGATATLKLLLENFGLLASMGEGGAPAVKTSNASGATLVRMLDASEIDANAFVPVSTDTINVDSGAVILDASYAPVTIVNAGVCWAAAIANPNTVVQPSAAGAMFANTAGGVGTTLWVARTGANNGWFNLG